MKNVGVPFTPLRAPLRGSSSVVDLPHLPYFAQDSDESSDLNGPFNEVGNQHTLRSCESGSSHRRFGMISAMR